jgi:putative lipoic acid-binding regulatory protein
LSDIAGILAEFNVKRGPERGQASKGGKYTTLKLPVTFDDRDMMERISSEISKVDSVKFLL